MGSVTGFRPGRAAKVEKEFAELKAAMLRLLTTLNENDQLKYQVDLRTDELTKSRDQFRQIVAGVVEKFGPFELTDEEQSLAYQNAPRAVIEALAARRATRFDLNETVAQRELPPPPPQRPVAVDTPPDTPGEGRTEGEAAPASDPESHEADQGESTSPAAS